MAQVNYETVKTSLPLLSETQLKDIMNRCKLLMTKTQVVDTNEDWLLDALLTELRMLGITTPSLAKITQHHQFKSFTEKSERIRAVLLEQGPLTRTEKRQLAQLCAKCLVEYLRSFTDVSLSNMLTYTDYLPQAIERAFPGYLANGVLPCLVKRFPESERVVH